MKSLSGSFTALRRGIFAFFAVTATIATPSTVAAGNPCDTFSGDDYEANQEDAFYPEIIKIESPGQREALEELGVIVLRERGRFLLTYIPSDVYDDVMPSPRRVAGKRVPSLPRRSVPTMDIAKSAFGADRIVTGLGLPSPYTGKGVVAGICDIGFDPSHPAFTDERGQSRVALFVQYREAQGERLVYSGPVSMKGITDTDEESHGSHVAGIFASRDLGNGYRGMAPDAEIVMTASQLSDVGLLAGVEDIIEYAASVGKPAVVNLSMGNYIGPHDGSSYFAQYLDMLAREAVVCISSGNEGSHNNTLSFVPASDEDSFPLRMASRNWVQFDMYGMTDFWSADDSPISFSLMVYDESDRKVMHEFEPVPLDNDTWVLSGDEDSPWYDEDFARYYTGWVKVERQVYPDNGRYNLSFQYDAHTEPQSDYGPWARYNLAFRAGGRKGVPIHAYADGVYSFFKPMPGGPMPGSELSFSDLATGHHTISVGMWNTRAEVPTILGETEKMGVPEGEVNGSSGYATLLDGRVMPHTVAPGCFMVSCANHAWAVHHRDATAAAMLSDDNEEIYWYANAGTSMSSPYTAGVIATWLEAFPQLTPEEVRATILATNRHDYPSPTDPRHGQGWLDPYAGLSLLFAEAGIKSPVEVKPDLNSLRYDRGVLRVTDSYFPTVAIYNLQGTKVYEKSISAPAEIDLSHFAKGIYMAVQGPNALKIQVK